MPKSSDFSKKKKEVWPLVWSKLEGVFAPFSLEECSVVPGPNWINFAIYNVVLYFLKPIKILERAFLSKGMKKLSFESWSNIQFDEILMHGNQTYTDWDFPGTSYFVTLI